MPRLESNTRETALYISTHHSTLPEQGTSERVTLTIIESPPLGSTVLCRLQTAVPSTQPRYAPLALDLNFIPTFRTCRPCTLPTTFPRSVPQHIRARGKPDSTTQVTLEYAVCTSNPSRRRLKHETKPPPVRELKNGSVAECSTSTAANVHAH